MYFRSYDDDFSTLREWSRQLGVVSDCNFPLYPTVEQTLEHWRYLLDVSLNTNTFSTFSTPEMTIHNWKDKLNMLYNM